MDSTPLWWPDLYQKHTTTSLSSRWESSRSITFAPSNHHRLQWSKTSKNLIDCKSGTFAYLSSLPSVLSLFVLARVNKQVPSHSINRRCIDQRSFFSLPLPSLSPLLVTHLPQSLEAGSKWNIGSSTKLLTHPILLGTRLRPRPGKAVWFDKWVIMFSGKT